MIRSVLVLIASLFLTGTTMAYEEPKYQLLLTADDIELRRYEPMLIAEVFVDGDMDDASSKGFRLIANYIFGNNQAADKSDSEKIAMTTPVTIEPQAEKIAMTAPVTVEPDSRDASMQTSTAWRVSFVMPSQYTLASIPKPNNSAVSLREVPAKYFVVLRYSGFNNLAKIQTLTDQVLAWSTANGFKVSGIPQLSRYDPPWTLPMFRRNEIMVEIVQPEPKQLIR